MYHNTQKVSVIIPVFNRKKTIERAINSLLTQSRLPDEILVIDDASNDGTAEILQAYHSKIKIFTLKNNWGVSAARNRGILEAKGEWIAFLDSDDEWLESKLERQLDYLKLHPEIHILQSDEQWIRNEKKVNPPLKYLKKGGEIFQDCLKRCIVGPSTVICRKALLEKMGAFDEQLPVCEDYDLWLRIASQYPIALLNEKLINKYGGHEDQLSTMTPALDRYRVKSLEKIYHHVQLTPMQKRAVLDELILKLGYLYQGAKRRGIDADLYLKKLEDYKRLST